MTREEAIAQLKEINREVSIYSEAVDMAIEALEADVPDTNQEPQGRFMEERIHKIHVYYITNNTFGDATITQSSYAPITPEVLEDMKELIREKNGYSEETEIIIACWQRYEG